MNLSRRSFMGLAGVTAIASVGSAATGGSASAPTAVATWQGWTKGHFQVHFIHTGVGEQMFWIMPDGTTMLLDCGDQAAMTRMELAVPVLPGPERLAGEWIARYVKRVNPAGNKVDYMFLSHYHADHSGTPTWQSHSPRGRDWKWDYFRSGFALAAEQLVFAKAIDRAWPTWDDPIPKTEGCDYERLHMEKTYNWLAKRDGLKVERFRLGATDQLVPLRDPAACADFSVRNICANGRIADREGKIIDLYKDLIDRTHPTVLNENGMSLGLIVTYGKFKFFTAGDFSDRIRAADGSVHEIEDDLAKVVEPCDVAKVNHHGHHGNPASIIAALRPRVWINATWDTLHMLPDVMERLGDRTIYPGPRLICPTVFPESRWQEDAGKAYLKDLAPASRGGGHIVLDVQPGGEKYSITYLTADDESMRVKSTEEFSTRRGE